MVVFSMTKDGRTTILADFTHRFDKSPLQSSYIHSFWLTNNYIIIPETPLTFQDKGKNMMLNGSVLSSLSWNSKSPTWCHVIRRHIDRPGQDGLVASIPVPSFFTFHAGNAFESICASTGNTMLTLDCASFVNGDVMHQLYRFGLPHRKGPSVTRAKQTTFLNGIATPPARQTEFGDYIRYKLNLDQSKVVSIDTLANNVEFPRFNQAYAMKATNQFVYGCQLYGFTEKMDETGGLVKMNLKNKDLKTYGEEGSVCSEPIFVPRPGAEKEDDGVLLSLVNDSNCCYFIVIDALDMKELARVRIGYFTAVTFHGSYVDHEFESINVN
jgi:torulene dioxygenase